MTANLPHWATQCPRADDLALGTNGGLAAGFGSGNADTEALKSLQPVLDAQVPDPSKGVPIDVSDVAEAIVFLASDASKKISGAILPVDTAWSTI